MKKLYVSSLITYLTLTTGSSDAFSFKKSLGSLFSLGTTEKETFERDYPLKPQSTLTIKNINGNIHLATWSKPTASIKIIKQAKQKDLLSSLTIKEQQHAKGLTLSAECNDRKNKDPRFDFHITIPHNTALNMSTGKGNIAIEKITGRTEISTENGNITINQAHSTVIAQTTNTGNIYIKEIYNNSKVSTHTGTITIDDARGSVIALTDNGHIKIHSSIVPPTGKIDAKSIYGNIDLSIPATTNAEIQARTERGVVTSQHYITLKPLTTQLDKYAWKKFKKEMYATIGTGEAQITLASNKSNIRLNKLTPTHKK
jgi:DUF4097 and DUF4098 domain-containing protein YvlB